MYFITVFLGCSLLVCCFGGLFVDYRKFSTILHRKWLRHSEFTQSYVVMTARLVSMKLFFFPLPNDIKVTSLGCNKLLSLKHIKNIITTKTDHNRYGYVTVSINFFMVALCFFNPLPDDKILDWSKLKQIAVDILKCI